MNDPLQPSPRVGDRRFTAKGERTRAAILDAAERQFSERGYEGVSLRQIMQEAGVQMGQLQHYFSSKEDVFSSVLERRLPEVIGGYADALAGLERLEESGGVDIRAVVRAIMAISRKWLTGCDAGRHRYLKMLGLSTISFSQNEYVAKHAEAFRPLNEISASWLARLYPGLADDRIQAAFQLIEAGLLSLYVNIDGLFMRSGRARTPEAVAALYDDLEIFLVGGVERVLTPHQIAS